MAKNATSVNYVALLQDQSHVCTCLLLFSEGLICRHFFQIMLQTQHAKFSIKLIMSRWYKKDMDLHNVNTVFDSSGIFNYADTQFNSNQLMTGIHNLRQDYLIHNSEVDHTITKRQIYGECAALGRKLASLAAEYHVTHIVATLQGLIQQVEQSNINDTRDQPQETVHNPSQVNAKGRPAKRLKSCIENSSKNSKGHINTGDTYTCRNCLVNGHNARSCVAPCKICKENGHTYLHCRNKENV